MKKALLFLLALLLALGLAAPALAFTGDSEADPDVPFTLDIYLVDYEDNDFFGFAGLPKSDRGYAKNEVVACVVELYAPKGENPFADFRYQRLALAGESVDFLVTENLDFFHLPKSSNVGMLLPVRLEEDEMIFMFHEDAFDASAKAQTFRMLFYAKVTGEDASITVRLDDGYGNTEFNGLNNDLLDVTLDGVLYYVDKYNDTDGSHAYNVYPREGEYLGANVWMGVDKNHVSEYMALATPGGMPYYLGFAKGGDIGVVVDGVVKTSGSVYEDIMEIYEEIVVDAFGLDYSNIGNYLRDSYFEKLVSPDTLSATVEIKPYAAYVAVPENIITDPPKTGDAGSLLGFALIALSSAGAFALRKRA